MELRVPSSLSVSRYSPMSLPPQLEPQFRPSRASFSVETSDSLTEEDEVSTGGGVRRGEVR